MRAASAAVAALCVARAVATLGPLVPDTTIINGCVVNPGDTISACVDTGPTTSAYCLAACAARGDCSAFTWHDAAQGIWAYRCVLRLDSVTNFVSCGYNCGHTSAKMTAGWSPFAPTPAPSSTSHSTASSVPVAAIVVPLVLMQSGHPFQGYVYPPQSGLPQGPPGYDHLP